MAKYKEITLVLEITPEMLLHTGTEQDASPGNTDDASDGAEE